MGLIRNFMTVFGVIAVFGIVYLFIKPDWYDKLASNQPSASAVKNVVGSIRTVYDKEKCTLDKETADNSPLTMNDVADSFGTGIPSKTAPYLLVVDKMNNRMSYWKLSPNVKKIVMKNSNSLSVTVHEREATESSPSYQMEIWTCSPVNLNLQFELGNGEK